MALGMVMMQGAPCARGGSLLLHVVIHGTPVSACFYCLICVQCSREFSSVLMCGRGLLPRDRYCMVGRMMLRLRCCSMLLVLNIT